MSNFYQQHKFIKKKVDIIGKFLFLYLKKYDIGPVCRIRARNDLSSNLRKTTQGAKWVNLIKKIVLG